MRSSSEEKKRKGFVPRCVGSSNGHFGRERSSFRVHFLAETTLEKAQKTARPGGIESGRRAGLYKTRRRYP